MKSYVKLVFAGLSFAIYIAFASFISLAANSKNPDGAEAFATATINNANPRAVAPQPIPAKKSIYKDEHDQ